MTNQGNHVGLPLLVTVAALGAAFVYITKATPIYTSTSRIYVEQSGTKILTEAESVMTQSKNSLYTQAELLRTTLVFDPKTRIPPKMNKKNLKNPKFPPIPANLVT